MTTAPMPDGSRRDGPSSDAYGRDVYSRDAYSVDGYGPGPARPGRPRPTRPQVDAGKLWPGGVATAVVAGLVALVGVLVCRWLFGIPLLAPKSDGAYGDVHTTDLVLLAAAAALVATALAHLLLLSTPRPLTFFGWIIGLATVLAVLLPFSTAAPLTAKVATAVVDLVLGVAIGSLISGVAARSVRMPPGTSAGYLGGSASMYDEGRSASGLS
jgi:Family of unknown function (DUF6069)